MSPLFSLSRYLFMSRRVRGFTRALAALLLAAATLHVAAQPLPAADPDDGKTFRAIALHDVRENVRQTFDRDPEPTALDERTLAEFFAWLQTADYRPVSLQQIVDARAGGAPLPPRAVLLSFDDGYASVYTKAYPLLKRFRYPAVVALVTGWMEVPPGQTVSAYGTSIASAPPPPRESFLTWAQAREMAGSGLVEFASHSDAMHTGIPGNPQGNLQPAATTFAYDATTGRYEREAAYLARIEADLRRSRTLIEQRTGSRVRAMVWPYGAYNREALRAADRAGMPITLTLDDGPNTAQVPLQEIRRSLATYDMQIPALALLRAPTAPGPFAFNRAMQVDLDYVYDADPAQQEANLSLLLDRVRAISPSVVYLQAYSDPDGNGVADALYFPNRHLPMRADLFNRVAWQLRTRTGVQVYAWMPVMAFKAPTGDPLAAKRVEQLGKGPTTGDRYERLSPFDPAVRTWIGDIYEDLGRNASVTGLLFHDDAAFADDEDAGPAALDTYARWGLPRDIAAIRANPALATRWSEAKTKFLTDFTLELAGRTRAWQPRILTARNVYARPLLEPAAESEFAQNYAQSLAAYDYTVVMAMPYMEEQSDPTGWLTALVKRAAATPNGLDRTVFELQARDWRTNQPVPDATLRAQWSLLHRLGARHLAYYPDDFHNDQPGLAVVRSALSVRENLEEKSEPLDTPPALALPKPTPPIAPVTPADAAAPGTTNLPSAPGKTAP